MLLPTGCTLDAVSYTEKTNENFPTTADDVAQSLAGIYQNLNQANANAQMTFYYISVLASDDNLGGGGTNDKLMQAVDLLCNYQQDMTHQFWIDRYQGISRANDLLSALETMDNEDGTLDVYKGEALFLRAFYYYELCSQYGNVPLVLEPTTEQVPQATAAEAWGQILQDLRDAIELMPDTRRTDGHVDKYGAEAMLGRAWLFYTGMYGNGEELADLTSTSYNPLTSVDLPDGTTMTKDDVIAYIDDCVDNSGYSLVSDYRNLWAYTNRYTVEDYYYTTGQGLQWVEDDNAVNPESLFAIKFNKLADLEQHHRLCQHLCAAIRCTRRTGLCQHLPLRPRLGSRAGSPESGQCLGRRRAGRHAPGSLHTGCQRAARLHLWRLVGLCAGDGLPRKEAKPRLCNRR